MGEILKFRLSCINFVSAPCSNGLQKTEISSSPKNALVHMDQVDELIIQVMVNIVNFILRQFTNSVL